MIIFDLYQQYKLNFTKKPNIKFIMNNASFFDKGTSEDFPEYINERIRASNMLAIIVGSLAFPFVFVVYNFAPSLTGLIVFQIIVIYSVVFLNDQGFINLSRYVFCMGGITLFTILHCYIMQDHQAIIAGLYGIQITFWLFPILVFDVKERTNLLYNVIYVLIISAFIPFFNNIFSYKMDVAVLETGWVGMALHISTIFAFISLIWFFVRFNENYNTKNEALFLEMEMKNKSMQKNESKLNEYIEEVKKAHEEEKRRKWIADGLAKTSEILYSNTNTQTMFDNLVSMIVKYVGANQAGIFIKETDENNQIYLELKACYAYERKKYITKIIQPGEGLVGQCFLEQESIFMTKIPANYVYITSGLGQATPKCVFISPLKMNSNMEGVLEIASLKIFEKFELEFIEKVSESIASVISSLKINERTKILLEQSQLNQEQMRAQEEEMRQNLEELMATQEEMGRKERELVAQADLMEMMIDNIPFPVFIKDNVGKYILVNKAETDIFNVPKSEIIGFDDSKFVIDKMEMERIRKSDAQIVKENVPVHFPEQTLTLDNGTVKVFKTSKIPFFNKITQQMNILGVSVDLSDTKNMEKKLQQEINALKAKLES